MNEEETTNIKRVDTANFSPLLLSLSIVFFLIGIYYNIATTNINIFDKKNEGKFEIEIADTKEKRSLGLSYRKNLCDRCAMLFIFEKAGHYAFWMKDMNFDLDILYINDRKEVVEIFENVKKESYYSDNVENSEKIKNSNIAKYVLEINSGKVKQMGIKIGDKIIN